MLDHCLNAARFHRQQEILHSLPVVQNDMVGAVTFLDGAKRHRARRASISGSPGSNAELLQSYRLQNDKLEGIINTDTRLLKKAECLNDSEDSYFTLTERCRMQAPAGRIYGYFFKVEELPRPAFEFHSAFRQTERLARVYGAADQSPEPAALPARRHLPPPRPAGYSYWQPPHPQMPR